MAGRSSYADHSLDRRRTLEMRRRSQIPSPKGLDGRAPIGHVGAGCAAVIAGGRPGGSALARRAPTLGKRGASTPPRRSPASPGASGATRRNHAASGRRQHRGEEVRDRAGRRDGRREIALGEERRRPVRPGDAHRERARPNRRDQRSRSHISRHGPRATPQGALTVLWGRRWLLARRSRGRGAPGDRPVVSADDWASGGGAERASDGDSAKRIGIESELTLPHRAPGRGTRPRRGGPA